MNFNEQTEEKTVQPAGEATPAAAPAAAAGQSHGRRQGGRGGRRDDRRGGGRGKRDDRPSDGIDARIIDLARVTRVMAGGKRMRFRACVVVGDKKGRIGMAVMKGADVQFAVAKATEKAKRHMITVPMVNGTIPHRVQVKFGSAIVLLKPSKLGTGIIAGGPVRIMMELAGVTNIVSKMMGSGNKINNVSAVMEAFQLLKARK